MANAIDNATARIQNIAQAMTGITIKSAPDYPVENAEPCPFVASYAASGNFYAVSASLLENFGMIAVEFHLSRVNIRQMQQQINAIVWEFPRRLAGDPTLDGNVATIVMTADQPLAYSVEPFQWAQITTQRLLFSVPVKLRTNPQATST